MLNSVGVGSYKSSTMRLNGNSPESSLWHVPGVIEPQKESEKKGLKKITNLLKPGHNFANVSMKFAGKIVNIT